MPDKQVATPLRRFSQFISETTSRLVHTLGIVSRFAGFIPAKPPPSPPPSPVPPFRSSFMESSAPKPAPPKPRDFTPH